MSARASIYSEGALRFGTEEQLDTIANRKRRNLDVLRPAKFGRDLDVGKMSVVFGALERRSHDTVGKSMSYTPNRQDEQQHI